MSDSFEPSSPALLDEDPRQLAGKLVNALYRLVKACQLHAETNQAVLQVIDYAALVSSSFCSRAGVSAVAILFTPHAVFVNRQMLKTSRETYQLALELGAMLEACEVTEVTLTSDVAKSEIAELGRAVAAKTRDGVRSPRFAEGGWDGLKVRRVVGFGGSANMPPHVRAARTYAAALMILRGFHDDLAQGKYELRQGIKRIAQKLVSQNELGARLLLSIAAAAPSDSDRASTLLASAILAYAMAAQLTSDRAVLTSLVSAALLYDVGRARLKGTGEISRARNLNADEEALLPTSSIAALAILGKLHPPNMVRAVIVHEAHAIREGQALYAGKRTPLLLSRVLATARAFAELRAPRPGAAGLGIDDALQVLESQAADNLGRTLVKLLVGALGIFPAGTLVELSSGEMAVVLATPALPVDFARPMVRILYDAQAQLLSEPVDVDLAQPGSGPARHIKRPIDSSDQQMKQMRAYVMGLATARARKKSVHKMAPMKEAPADAPAPRPPPAAAPASAPISSAPISSAPISSAPISSAPISGAPISGHPVPNPLTPRSDAFDSLEEPPASSNKAGPTVRPPTRKWDPRAESASGGEYAAQRKPTAPLRGETRSVSWDEYGKELSSAGISVAVAPESDANDTDALLAAYLAEDGQDVERPSSPGTGNRSWGLRWTQRSTGGHLHDAPSSSGPFSSRSSTGSSSGGASSGGIASHGSSQGSSQGHSVGGPLSSQGPASSQGHSVGGPMSSGGRSSAGLGPGWSSGRSATGRGSVDAGIPSSGARAQPNVPTAPPPASVKEDDPFSDVFDEKRAAPATSSRPAVQRQPTGPTGAISKAATAAAWASPQRSTGPVSHDPEPTPPESSVERPVPSVGSPVSKRAKAGSSAWGVKPPGKK